MSTNTNPIQFINPIDLSGNELLNSKIQIKETLPAAADYANQLISVSNILYYSNGTTWNNLSELSLTNVIVDNTNDTFSDFITNDYDPANFKEGDIIIFTIPNETYVHLGTATDTAADFQIIEHSIDNAVIRNALSAGNGLDYDNATGTFSVGTGEITETMLDANLQSKIDRNGTTFSLADTGVSNVTYANGAFTITHNFNTQSVAVVMRDSSNNYRQVPVNNDAPTVNTVKVYFAEQPTNNQYKVTVIPMVF